MTRVAITIDVEHDCPPFLETYQGIEEGLPRLLDLFHEENVHATFFTTGDVARRYPERVRRIVDEGHELGCHGDTHRRFSDMSAIEAEREIMEASTLLRTFGPVCSFRAPNLDFPREFLPILSEHGFTVDSSTGRHKPGSFFTPPARQGALRRVPASTPPSALRLGPVAPVLNFLSDPVVLFFHPWEFVDVTMRPIPIDCRFRTGQPALDSLRRTIHHFRGRGAEFLTMEPLANACLG